VKFITPSPKQAAICAIASLALNAWLLWSASMFPDVTCGITEFNAKGEPVISRIENPNRSKGLYLAAIANSVIAGIALARAKNEGGDRLIQKATLSEDISSTSKLLTNNAVCGLEFVSFRGAKFLFGKQSVARNIAVKVLPVEIRDRLSEAITQKDWFAQFLAERRHYLICGSTGDGKSMLLNAIIIEFLKRANGNTNADGTPKDRLSICDINYGKRDDQGNLNTWMDLDRAFISATADELMATVRSVVDELRVRRQADIDSATAKSKGDTKEHERLEAIAAKRGNILLVIEEHMSTRRSLLAVDKEVLKEFDNALNEILLYGRGYGVKCLIVLQYLNANDNGINLGERDQMCIILLKSMAVQAKQVEKMTDNAQELVLQFTEALKKFKYLALVQFGGGAPKIRKIPDLSWVSGVSLQSPSDPVSDWWNQIWTEANQQWIIDTLESGTSPLSSAKEVRSEFKTRFKVELSNDDARYVRLKTAIEQIKSQTKVLEKV
jgi:hypothetical protein